MNLNGAFRALDTLDEDTFSADAEGIKKLADFRDSDDLEDEVDIIDPDAKTEDDLDNDYVGKVILDCCTCHSKLYKDKDEIEIDEEDETLCNTAEECPYCYNVGGYKIVGEVKEFGKDDTEEVEEQEDAEVEESLTKSNTRDDISVGNEKATKDLTEAQAGTMEKPMSKMGGTLGNVLNAHASELSKISGKKSALELLDKVEGEVKNKGYLETVRKQIENMPESKVLTFLYNIILKGDGMGTRKNIKEYLGGDPRTNCVYSIFQYMDTLGPKKYQQVQDILVKHGAEVNEFGGISLANVSNQQLNDICDEINAMPSRRKKSVTEDTQAANVVDKYQEWVDYDMKKYGKISDITKGKLDKAGFEVIKDDHGDYEVIAKTNEACGKRRRKLREADDHTFNEMKKAIQDGTLNGMLTYDSEYVDYINGLYSEATDIVAKDYQDLYIEPSIQGGRGGVFASFTDEDGNSYEAEWDFEGEDSEITEIVLDADTEQDVITGIAGMINQNLEDAEIVDSEDDDEETPSTILETATWDGKGKPPHAKHVTIENGVTLISDDAFYNHIELKSITIPDSVKSIGYSAFDNSTGFTIHTTPGSYAEKYAKENDIPVVTDLKESRKFRKTNEDFNKVTVENSDGKVEVTDGEVKVTNIEKEDTKEVIEPISDETKIDIENNSEEEFADIDADEFDEESFDEVEESYLREHYSNVKSYKTHDVFSDGKKIYVEGVITFTSGNKKKTNYVLEGAVKSNNKPQVICENLQTKTRKIFNVKIEK